MITDQELAFIRADAQRAMNDHCTIQRQLWVSDKAGGQQQIWSNVGSARCVIAPFENYTSGEKVVAHQFSHTLFWAIYVPIETDVQSNDRIEIDGTRYHIVKIMRPTSCECLRTIIVQEVVA